MIEIDRSGPDYLEALQSSISKYLSTYFYDGPFDEKALMSAVMREGRGMLNPHQVFPVITAFLLAEPKYNFEYKQPK
jgi:hypothetical protein